jgi:2'-5' RNA ligase
MRCFIALDLSAAATKVLVEGAKRLKSLDQRGALRWSDPANYHLTLVFLGQVGAEEIPILCESMKTESVGKRCFDIRLTRLEYFPSARRPKVLAAVVANNEPLFELHRAMSMASTAIGFSPEKRRFRPHITLARTKAARPLVPLPTPLQCADSISEVVLYQSLLQPQGAIHTPLFKLALIPGHL